MVARVQVAQTRSLPRPLSNRALGGVAAPGRAVQELSNQLQRSGNVIGQAALKQRDIRRRTSLLSAKTQMIQDFNEYQAEREAGIKEGGQGHLQSFEQWSDQYIQERLPALSDGDEQHGEIVQAELEAIRGQYWSKFERFERNERNRHSIATVQEGLNEFAQQGAADPEQANFYYAEGLKEIDELEDEIGPAATDALRKDFGRQFAQGYAAERVARDPHGSQEGLRDDPIIRDNLEPHEITRLEQLAQTKVQQEKDRAEREAEKQKRDRQRAADAQRRQDEAQARAAERRTDDIIDAKRKHADVRGEEELRAELETLQEQVTDPLAREHIEAQLDRLDQVDAENEQIRDVMSLPLPEQADWIREQENAELSPSQIEQLDRVRSAHDEAIGAFERGEALQWADEAGLIELQPLDPTNPESIQQRAEQAAIIGSHFGRTDVMPMTETELQAMEQQIGRMDPEQQLQAMAGLQQAFPPDQYGRILDRLAQDMPGIGYAAELLNQDEQNRTLALEILQGQAMIDAGSAKAPTASEVDEVYEEVVGEAYSSDILLPREIKDAAIGHYVANNPGASFDKEKFAESIQEVLGGYEIIDWGGQKIPSPGKGRDKEYLNWRIDTLPDDQPLMYDNRGEVIPFSYLEERGAFSTTEYAELEPIGDGQYRVMIGGQGYALDKFGRPYILDFSDDAPMPDSARRHDPTDPAALPVSP